MQKRQKYLIDWHKTVLIISLSSFYHIWSLLILKKPYIVQRRFLYNRILHAVDLLLLYCFFYVHGKHLRSCRDGQLT